MNRTGSSRPLASLPRIDDQVADAALGELALDRRHPGAARAAVGAGRVQEDAGVAHELAAVGPLAPPVFDDQVIVAVRLLGGDVAVAVAGDVEQAVRDAEDLARVVALRVLEPGGEAGQVLAVEEADDLSRATGSAAARRLAGRASGQAQPRQADRGPAETPPASRRSSDVRHWQCFRARPRRMHRRPRLLLNTVYCFGDIDPFLPGER